MNKEELYLIGGGFALVGIALLVTGIVLRNVKERGIVTDVAKNSLNNGGLLNMAVGGSIILLAGTMIFLFNRSIPLGVNNE
jgi:hypothetical protein